MTTETTAPDVLRVAEGLTPDNPPTHIRIGYALAGGRVAGDVMLKLDSRTDERELWKTDPTWNYANGYEAPFLDPLELAGDGDDDMISDDLAEDFLDGVQAAANAAGVPFEWDHLSSDDVYVLAWWDSFSGDLHLDHAYGDEGSVRISDLRVQTTWTWCQEEAGDE
jgi:hypothetical protein